LKLPRRFTYPTLSPDGKLATWGSYRDRIHLRDVAADKDLRELELEHPFHSHFSADGKYLAAGSQVNDGESRLWETATGKELTQCRRKEVAAIAFSPDAKFIARSAFTALPDWPLETVDLATGKQLRRFPAKDTAGELAISPDGKFLASSHRDQTIQLWDVAKGESDLWIANHPARDRGPRTQLSWACPIAFSPDGKLLASGGDDHAVRLWDVATGKEVRKFAGHAGTILSLAFSADGKTLASASADTTVLIWDVAGK
jgi:WD40 repeat protein